MIITTDRLLAATDVDVDAFALCEIARDVCLVTPPVSAIEVHFVVAGTLHFSVPGSAPLTLHQGAVVVTPAGIPQQLAATLTSSHKVDAIAVCAPHPSGMMLFDATDTGNGDLRILCGKVRAEIAGSVGPLDSLTAPIAADLGDSPFVRGAFEAMVAETSAGGVGARVIVSALMKAVLAVLLRQHLADTAPAPSLLAQPQLARAVAEVVANPAAPHSVASLACVAGMSRSAFAKSFAAALDMSPMHFVSRTRMMHARDLLAGSGLPIAAIAARVGITSRSHFSRLFRSSYGCDPTTFRRRTQSGESCLAD
ncbi:AraC family transcriptional regulator [Sphingomonas sp. CARO-RG-8B-R24-01]|uniref:helix-turn-helix domain-containing protein n=1 Tax=Sphingomonas sp. CARO-RG-8B-R24-01 TaxID=2914831 RepID=UPI001F5A77FD|nr:AraC family transcriptional regulator [Sphingomonas sp. CARO-RG-8B-R24-01]